MAKGNKIAKKTNPAEPQLRKRVKSITKQSKIKGLTPYVGEMIIYVFVILLLSVGSYWRNRIWNNEIEFWTDCVNKSPNKARPHNNLAGAFNGQGRYQEAIAQLTEALRLNPNFAEVHYNLGNAFNGQGRYQEAIAQLTEALRLNPNLAEAHNNLGNAYFAIGNRAAVLKEYEILKTMNLGLAKDLYEKIK
jgi:tetratricopeptide (TPR) repeat protein